MSHYDHAADRYDERKERRRLRSRTRIRTRCGSWRTFERRFQPMPAPNHEVLWALRGEVPADGDDRRWWTVVDCDGRLYVTPGFRFVNRFAYIRCAVPWTDDDERQPDYRYD